MRALLAALLVTALAFSGCSETPAEGDGGEASASSSATTTPTTTGTRTGTGSSTASATGGTGPANGPPTAEIKAMGVGLAFNFTLEAADPDGDDLTYTFDADGAEPAEASGSGPFPLQVNFTYAAAGLYNATLVVSDGTLSGNATLRVNVTVAAAGAPQPVTFQGHADYPDPYNSLVVYPDGCAVQGIAGTDDGMFGTRFEVGDAYTGWAWSITSGATTMWWDTATDIVGSGPTGTVPADIAYVDTCVRPPARDMDFVLTLTPP